MISSRKHIRKGSWRVLEIGDTGFAVIIYKKVREGFTGR